MKIAWKQKNNTTLFYICSCMVIIVPSLLAGYRDTTVGHDIEVYMVPLFESLNTEENLAAFIIVSELESAFIIYNYLIRLFTDDIFWAFFVQQILVLSAVYYTCYRLRDKIDAPLYFLIYLLTMYCESMTMARQIFAISAIIFAYPFIMQRQWKYFVVVVVLAYFMHHSALLALPLYPFVVYFGKKNTQISIVNLFMVIVAGLILYMYFPSIVNVLIEYGILPVKYTKYTDQEFNTHKITVLITILCFFTSYFAKKNNIRQEIQVLAIIVFFMLLCGKYNDVAQRIAQYYEYYLFIRVLMVFESLYANNKKIAKTVTVFLLLSFFIFSATKYGFAEAIPYTSKSLNIR